MAGSFNRFATDIAGLLEIAADALTATKLVLPSSRLGPFPEHNRTEADLTFRRHFGTRERNH